MRVRGFLSISILIIIAVVTIVGGGSALIIQQKSERIEQGSIENERQTTNTLEYENELATTTSFKDDGEEELEVAKVVVETEESKKIEIDESEEEVSLLDDVEVEEEIKEDTSQPDLNNNEEGSDLEDDKIDYSKYSNFISRASFEDVEERDIDIRSIVLVRCKYVSQYAATTANIEAETQFSQGTGVFIDNSGTILTAGHVVREIPSYSDDTGREWSFSECEIARTKSYGGKILSKDPRTPFEDVNIIYEASDDLYSEALGFDVAVLKLKEVTEPTSYLELIPEMVGLEYGIYDSVAVGYPGKDIESQRLERFDGVFAGIDYFEGSKCKDKDYETACGWRYQFFRSDEDMKSFFGRQTWIGVESTNARGGLSGSPVLVEGKIIGILTHALEDVDYGPTRDVDWTSVLTSFDITTLLKREGIL